VRVESRENPIINRLNKTKVEKFPNLAEEKEARLKELRFRDRDAQQLRVSSIAIPRSTYRSRLHTSSFVGPVLLLLKSLC
jgi:hypothetical protein